MSWLCRHRDYISLDADELERAAGGLEILAKNEREKSHERGLYAGAACALRIMGERDVKDMNDLITVLELRTLGIHTNEIGERDGQS